MTPRQGINGLDTLRFVAAATVALSHGAAFPLGDWLGKGTLPAHVLIGAYNVSFDGVAAVIVFFVISGFCIHYSSAGGAPFKVLPFWTRRGIRILGPLIGALVVARMLGAAATGALEVVLWSVYCELIYYALYPLLRLAFQRFGLRRVLIASFAISASMIALDWKAPFYWSFSPALTWLLAAPAWLLGCVLAEHVVLRGGVARPPKVWLWRGAAFLYAAGATAAFFHAPIKLGYPLLLLPFYFIAFGWVRAEIAHFAAVKPSAVLEWCGQGSYSLYLIHNSVIAVTPILASAVAETWAFRVAMIVGGSLGFYAVVEAPSHWLARAASGRLAQASPRSGPVSVKTGAIKR